jgi:hypothetical protein
VARGGAPPQGGGTGTKVLEIGIWVGNVWHSVCL